MVDDPSRFVGSIPQIYDRVLGPVLFAPYAALMAERVAALAPTRVLETAAGGGIVTRALRGKLAGDADIVATDLNEAMLDVARGKFASHERVTFRAADAQALPFDGASFDALVCQFGVMFYPDKDKAHREARRVLAPDGRYLFSVWNPPPGTPWLDIVGAVLSRFFPADPPSFFHVPFNYAAIDPAVSALRAAGFSRIRADVMPHMAAIGDFSAFAHGMVFGNPSVEQIRARGVDPETFASAVEKDLRTAFGAAGAMPLEATFFQAE